jgi:hypothetical protein
VRKATLALVCLSACGELHPPATRATPGVEVRVEPVGDLGRAPAVLRLRVKNERGRSALEDFHFFEGSLSSYYLHRLAARDVPETLREREIGVLTWVDGPDIVVAPTRALAAGTFSLASPDLGLIAEVTVDAELVPWLARLWPPPSTLQGDGFSVFCGSAAARAAPGPAVLEPAAVGAELRFGIGDGALFADACVSLEPDAANLGAPELPPALAGSVALEPLPLARLSDALAPPACENQALVLGPTCATVDDDRVVLHALDEPSLWVVEEPESLLGVAAPGASLVVHGFEPETPVRFLATAFDRTGERTVVDTLVTGAEPHPHVAISEVLANPRGPESTGEWIELVNDGPEPVELGTFTLHDSAAAVPLPPASIDPGEYVLLAATGFAPDADQDVPPVSGTRVLTLPKLGQAGLANGGELLRLFDANGRVLSRFPALAAPEAGVSVARRAPDAPDEDDGSFGAHAPPGASPGAPNELAAAR